MIQPSVILGDINYFSKSKNLLCYLEAKIETYPETVGPEIGYMLYSGNKEVFENTKEMLKALGQMNYVGENPKAACVFDIAFLDVHCGATVGLFEAAAFCVKNDVSPVLFGEFIKEALPGTMDPNHEMLAEELSDYTGEFKDATGTDMRIEARGQKMVKDAMNSCDVNSIFADWSLEVLNKAIEQGYEKKNMVAIVNLMLNQ